MPIEPSDELALEPQDVRESAAASLFTSPTE
jgi:hypothetical protein